MKKVFKTIIKRLDVVALFMLFLFSTCLHYWEEPTCDSPKTCIICGKEEGEKLTHEISVWNTLVESTCYMNGMADGYCEYCGNRQYKVLETLPHTETDWVVDEEYIINEDGSVTPGREIKTCTVCDGLVDEREYTIELTETQSDAIFVSHLFVQYLHSSKDLLMNDVLVDEYGFSVEDAQFCVDNCGIDWKEEAVLAKQDYLKKDESRTDDNVRLWLSLLGFTDEEITYALEH